MKKVFLSTPNIIRENNSGIQSYRIQDEMFRNREIECVGEIDSDMVNSLISQIRYLASVDPEAEITIYINSPGGEVDSGLALYDVMKAVPCPIRTVCVGMAASMGAVLFVSGDRRQMLPHARVMIHDPLISCTGGSALHLKSVSDNLLRTRDILGEILAEHTGKSLKEIYKKTATDSYFYAMEAQKFGLCDDIITTL